MSCMTNCSLQLSSNKPYKTTNRMNPKIVKAQPSSNFQVEPPSRANSYHKPKRKTGTKDAPEQLAVLFLLTLKYGDNLRLRMRVEYMCWLGGKIKRWSSRHMCCRWWEKKTK
ncbi:hypothetical protein HanIR_Chr15g0782841 [Helianthus annuus]|nr:hypothetical protein HanIR_Chr15g0782841 [Helianthus annuus]